MQVRHRVTRGRRSKFCHRSFLMGNMNSICALRCSVTVTHRSFFSVLLTWSRRMEVMLVFLVEKLMIVDELDAMRLVLH